VPFLTLDMRQASLHSQALS